MIQYLNYNILNIDEELIKIENCKTAEIVLEPENKNCLFILGMLFVNGVKIKILNEKDINFEKTDKSFPIMAYVWSKIGDNKFPAPDYSNIKTDIDSRVADIKRIGVKLNKIVDKPNGLKILQRKNSMLVILFMLHTYIQNKLIFWAVMLFVNKMQKL